MSKVVQAELPLNVDKLDEASQTFEKKFDETSDTAKEVGPDVVENKLSEREFKMAMARAYKERNDKIKQNKEMLMEMNLEVDYWKAQADLLRYRFEKMDFFIKNLELEPKYLAAVEMQKTKEAQQTPIATNPILVK